ncbi:Hypp7961 [Branchiostoma lanceolatum]|uniref:Hypp7961 protein n=1 Tax=Branchiostoma lanceolatum TaxID=7740 RepID=A0A8K0EDB5_BRALA|nr:Hypp7961 [Branchiostoma lanceolatum]
MVVGAKTKCLRTVFLAFLAVLTVQCVHSLTAPTPTHTQTMYVSPTHTQTMHSTDEMATISTLPKSTAAVCNSSMNCTQTEYCDELENPNAPGVCQSCHDSCEGCSGPGKMDCTRCNATKFIVQHVVYDGETTTPTGPNTTVQTTAATTTARTTVMTTSLRTTPRSTDVTDGLTSSSTHPNTTTPMSTGSTSTETTPAEPKNYTIKVECVDECPVDLEPPSNSSKLCCHVRCKDRGCYGNSSSDCCHSDCTNGCYGDGSEKCCPEDCHPDYGCDHNGSCRGFVAVPVPTNREPTLPLWAYGLIGGGGAIVLTGGIIAISCCIRRGNCRGRPREEDDGGEDRIEMKKRRTKKKKRNSYVPSPNSVREMNEDGPYANGEYVDPAGVSNPALQPDDGAYDDVNVHPDAVYVEPQPDQYNPDDVYVEPQPDQFNPDSTEDGIYDQPPPEEVNQHMGYGYHGDAPAQQEAVYGNDPDPVSGEQYPVSADQYPVSADQYPVSGDIDQSGFASVEPVYQNTGFAAQANETQPDLSIYQNLEESNPQPAAHEDLPVYYDYTAQHGNSGFPPPPPEDDEQCLSVDSQNSFPSLPPPLPPGDLSRFPPPLPEDDEQCLSVDSQNSFPSLPPPLPPGDLPSLPPPPPPEEPLAQPPRHTASPPRTAGGRKKTRRVPPPPPAGPRPESARRVQRPPRVAIRQPEPEIYGYDNEPGDVYGYDN